MYPFFEKDILGVAADTANPLALGVIALVAILILFFLYRLITRPRLASGRRSRHARLAITDAASVDDRRKLVLVRRDDVEHLIMIGGTTDMVIESDIRRTEISNQKPAPVQPQVQVQAAPARAPVPAPAPAPAPRRRPVAAPAPTPAARPVAQPAAPVANRVAAPPPRKPAPPVQPTATTGAAPVVATPAAPSANKDTPAVSVTNNAPSAKVDAPKTTMGDDMDALLDEMATKK